ncbi:complement receptor type 2 isoform X3 [Carassius carassius]|uniref:complement receptor type 2 isoform X3 n=1 Tax=Carassius carassius TaxID=217509 RepID=UPI00286873C4|nr:complement receptor type 2 isoform X3 [Carassius carassius]
MALVWRKILILLFVHFVVSQRRVLPRCGEPRKYPDKQLLEKYLQKVEFNHGKRVMYKCAPGYETSAGSRTSSCVQGQWQTLNMKCQKKKCNALGDIENGRYNQEGRSFGDKAIAVCNEGYVLKGERVRICTEKGWNGTDPICEVSKIICSAPAVANRQLKSGERTQYAPQDTVNIICSEGFDLIGLPQVTCGRDGQWQDLPVCSKVITCSAPAVANGRIRPGSRVYKPKDTVDITCREGFDLIGPAQVKCGPYGQWQALPECRPKRITDKCGPPPSYPHALPRDGSSTLREYPSDAGIRYKCSIGYGRVRGITVIHCQNGQWTELQLQCERKKCGSAGEISNGQFEYTGVSFGDTATAVCEEGYELIGSKVQTCRDGGWDGRRAVCEPVHCPPPPEVRGAEMLDPIYDHVPFGHVLTYHCRTGALIGEREIYCTKSGTWSAPPPVCRDIICPSPLVPGGSRMRGFRAVYRFGNSLTIACNPGSRLRGQSFVTCGSDGEWIPKLPQCV